MKKTLIALSIAAGALLVGANPAGAAGSLCYGVQVTANGQSVVSEAACHQLP